MSAVAPLDAGDTSTLDAPGQPAVLVVEDDPSLREALCDTLAVAGYPTMGAHDGTDALQRVNSHRPGEIGLVVSDVQMSPMGGLELLRSLKQRQCEIPVLRRTAHGTSQQAGDARHDGACDYLVKPCEAEVLASKVSHYCRASTQPESEGTIGMVGADPASCELSELACRVAASDVTVMVSGESGVGKEVLARYIHTNSARVDGPFVALNCAAIPENMLEAILFGYEKGAYTGAHKACPGKFEQADGGTLLLDEISEMALGLQAKLLRVLQEREVERLGAREPIQLDVRVLATTNRDLAAEVAAGRFREDLYYRLNVFPMRVLPLRERRLDIAPLARHLLKRAGEVGRRPVPELTPDALTKLMMHGWPGNVRELDNVVQRALVLCQATHIDAQAIVFEPGAFRPALETTEPADVETLGEELKVNEFRFLRDALDACGGNRKEVAERLGISPRTLRYKLARMRDAGLDVR